MLFALLASSISNAALAQFEQAFVSTSANQPPSDSYRILAPGVETVVPSPVEPADTYHRHDMVEILANDPKFGERDWSKQVSPARNVRFATEAWGLEFAFKPVRFIRVAVPQAATGADERLVWYLVYRVRNPGGEPVRFVPRFWLHSYDVDTDYEDRLLPGVVPLIQRREDPNRTLYSTAEMMGREIPPSSGEEEGSVWGVVTWTGVSPETDRFSIFVQGLTNAYRWEDDPSLAAGDPPGKGRKFTVKTLQINFWRPGDEFHEHEGEIRLGIPGEVDYQWLYR